MKASYLKFILTLAVILTSGVAHAEYWVFAGTNCMEKNDSSPDMYYRYTVAYNSSSSATKTVVCPLSLDNTNLSQDSVYIGVIDRHPTLAVECTLFETNIYGGTQRQGDTKASGGTGAKELSLGKVSYYSDTQAYIECTVPPISSSSSTNQMSGIGGYEINN